MGRGRRFIGGNQGTGGPGLAVAAFIALTPIAGAALGPARLDRPHGTNRTGHFLPGSSDRAPARRSSWARISSIWRRISARAGSAAGAAGSAGASGSAALGA